MKPYSLVLFAALVGFAAAHAHAAPRPSGRVVAVAENRVDIALERYDVPGAGAIFEVRRVTQGPPKAITTGTTRRVGRIRIESATTQGRAQAVLIDGSARRGDRVRLLTPAEH